MKTFGILAALLLTTSFGTAAALLDSPQKGGLQIKSLSSLSFGPEGLLLVAEPATASVVAIQTGDVGPPEYPRHGLLAQLPQLPRRSCNVGEARKYPVGFTSSS